MKRLSTALLAIGLLSSSAAFAQSGYYPPDNSYNDGYNDRNDNSYRGNNQQGDAYYDYARVIRVDPVIGSYRGTANNGNQRCYETQSAGSYPRDGYYGNGNQYGSNGYNRNDPYGRSQYGGGSTTGRNVATVVGGIAGAVLGSKIGGGSGTYAATAIGTMVGGMAGRQVYENTQRDRYTPAGTVRVCDPEPAGNGYYSRTNDGRASAYDVTYEYNGRRYTRRMDHHPGDRVRVRVDVTPQ
ncbi:glycine zipper 2TM domain-containing protein [Thermomonas sp.]|uniref:glycine zipper 2TM domain-containing protein n=1 Tax=Thermomonas sp. TaxID=1971895 RepID=UPI00248A3FCC|nr:glycine zipper 2TM domain-containing protein [Thermomonas sp.]MDI1251936.1 glycine zipper 2TM domain-containing protein [Thermomonas sp.]